MQLIIVESPTKARTLSKFLGKEYRIEASMGHVRDLPKSELGVDVQAGFSPSYIIPRAKSKNVTALKNAAKNADIILLATDPDREGEAIAWHIDRILSDAEPKGKKRKVNVQRITFHEITKQAIEDAMAHPGIIDTNLVDAQQARRVLDRLVGYTLSPLLWKKLSKRWLSAGRVQSVAVRLIVEREREISAFLTKEYWSIEGAFGFGDTVQKDQVLQALLVSKNGEKYEHTLRYDLFDGTYTTKTTTIDTQDKAQAIITDLQAPYTVRAADRKEIRRSAPGPYTTSTLQQDAGRLLYFSSKKTMQIAQKLYEEGYITYHRTDSMNLSDQFVCDARGYIGETYGKPYVPASPRKFKTKSKIAQEAHEAIRPTDIRAIGTVAKQEGQLNRDHIRLYELIWKRTVASQAADAVFDATTIRITSTNGYEFEASGSVVTFDGYLKITGKRSDDVLIPPVAEGQEVMLTQSDPVRHETNPPPRYTEASLVKTLEEKGIGRPSTYAPIISTIIERQYITRTEKKLVPTELGFAVTDFLVKYFSDILELPFTATLEDKLDAVASGEKKWQPIIGEFFTPFKLAVDGAYEQAEKVRITEEKLDETCPECGHELVVRMGKFGKFVACTNFPECSYTRQYGEKIDIPCPSCGGDIVTKKSKRGKKFYGCSNYPTCTFAAWHKEEIKKK